MAELHEFQQGPAERAQGKTTCDANGKTMNHQDVLANGSAADFVRRADDHAGVKR